MRKRLDSPPTPVRTRVGRGTVESATLLAELVDLPCVDLSLQIELPKLLSRALGRLCEAIAEDDELAGEAVLDEVLDELDTPLERARLARAVIALRDGGRCGRLL